MRYRIQQQPIVIIDVPIHQSSFSYCIHHPVVLLIHLRCLPIVEPGDNFDSLDKFSFVSESSKSAHCCSRCSAT